MCMYVEGRKNSRDDEALLPWSRSMAHVIETRYCPNMCYHRISYALSQNVTDGTVRSFASRPSRSPKVIGTDTDRLATYDFVLVFHSIVCSMGLSRTVFEIKDNICKIFLPTVHLASLLRGSLDFCNGSEN